MIDVEGHESLNQKSVKKANLLNQLNLLGKKAQNFDSENILLDTIKVNPMYNGVEYGKQQQSGPSYGNQKNNLTQRA